MGGRDLLGTVFKITGLASGALGFGFLAASPWLADRLSDDERLLPILIIFGLALPAASWLRVGAASTRVSQDLRASVATEDFGQPFVFALLAAVLLGMGGGVVAASLAAGLSFVTMGAAAMWWARKWFPQAPPGEDPGVRAVSPSRLIAYSVPTAVAGTVGVTMTWLDRLLVGFYMTEEAVGWYQTAAQASGVFAVVLSAFNAIFTPMIAGLLERSEHDRLQELFRIATKWGILAVLPGAALCLLFSGSAIVALFGQDYAPAAAPLVILVVGQLANVCTGAVGYLLMMSGRQNLWLGLSLAALAADVVLNMVLIPRYGLVGASVATAISVAALYGAGLVVVWRTMKLWPHGRRTWRVAATAGAVFAAALLWRGTGGLPPAATVAAVLAGASVLTLAGWRLLCFEEADRLLVSKLTGGRWG